MPPFRVKYVFESPTAKYGWSELFYDNTRSTQQAAVTFADGTIKPLRVAMLSAEHFLRYVVASDVNPQRDSLVKAYTGASGAGQGAIPIGGVGDWGNLNDETMPACVALLLRMEAGPTMRRMFTMRGIPLGAFGAQMVYQPTAAFDNALKAWSAAVVGASGYSLQGVSIPPGSWQFPTATTVSGSGFGLSVVLPGAAAPAGWVQSAVIKFSKFLNAAFVNGNWRISNVLPNSPAGSTTVTFWPKQRPIFGTPVPGACAVITPTPAPFTSVIPLRGVKRNTGRPFGLPHGRSRVRKS